MHHLTLHLLHKTHPGTTRPAVNGLNLEVQPGEFMVLVGPSGCGKSTLLRLVAGLEAPDSGDILLDGASILARPPARRDMAMVFQGYALYPQMTVQENMEFALRLRKVPAPERLARVRQAAELLGLTELLNRRPAQLSGGERQRTALGRAMVRQPKVFLLDEPLSNLDAGQRQTMRTEIARLHRTLGATMLYVTHDQSEAMTLGDRIAVMRNGLLHQVGTPAELRSAPADAFVAGFLGQPPMNLLPGQLQGDRPVRFTADAASLSFCLPDSWGRPAAGPCLLGLRPGALRVAAAARPGEVAFEAMVELVEQPDEDCLLHLLAGPSRLVARCPAASAPPAGSRRPFAFDPQEAHFFRMPGGQRLQPHPLEP